MSLTVNNPFEDTSGGGGSGGDVPNASTTTAGKVKLSNAIDSDSQTVASTPLAVKTAISEANNYTNDVFAELVHEGTTPPTNMSLFWNDTSI